MRYKNIWQYAVEGEKKEETLYIKAFMDYLETYHKASKESLKPIIIDLMHMTQAIKNEFQILDNWLDNFSGTEMIFKHSLREWSGLNRDYHIIVGDYYPNIDYHKLNHTHKDQLIRFRGYIDSCGNFCASAVYYKYECIACGNIHIINKKLSKSSRHQCGCGNQSKYKEIIKDRVEKSRVYFTVHEDSINQNTSGNIPCYYFSENPNHENYLVDASLVGQYVEFVGILRSMPKIVNMEYLEFFSIEIKGLKITKSRIINIERKQEIINTIRQDKDSFFKIALSMAKETEGQEYMKLCILASAIGLNSRDKDLGIHRNPQFHILLCGNPATGKTFTAKQFNNYFPRSAMIQGKSSTSAGVLGGAEKSQGDNFIIKVGIVKRSDGSFIIMDEIDKMGEETKKGLFTALSEGHHTITNVSGSYNFYYNTNFIMIANPINAKFDIHSSYYSQIDLDSAFLSRADIIHFPEKIYLENGKFNDVLLTKLLKNIVSREYSRQDIFYNDEFLKDYAMLVKEYPNPLLTESSKKKIHDFLFSRIKDIHTLTEFAKTGEFIESDNLEFKDLDERHSITIIKLSKIIARARFSPTVEPEDVDRAINIIEVAMIKSLLNKGIESLDVTIENIGNSQKIIMPKSMSQKMGAMLKIFYEVNESILFEDILKKGFDLGMTEYEIDTILAKLSKEGEISENPRGTFRRIK